MYEPMYEAMYDDPMLFCADCAGLQPVLAPPCADGHGDDCPDRCCAGCGAAFVLDPALDPASGPVRDRNGARFGAGSLGALTTPSFVAA